MSEEKSEKYRHDLSPYERPTFPYRCGRVARWDKPCWQGPTIKGGCGGEVECVPVRKGDRYECRRPLRAGGMCDEGPDAYGRCAHTHFACVPRPSLRTQRKTYIFLASGLCIALIAFFTQFQSFSTLGTIGIDPGGLSSVHAGISTVHGCAACHAAHDEKALDWVLAAFVSQREQLIDKCVACHNFGGPTKAAHSATFANRTDIPQSNCFSCHREHQGSDFNLTQVKDVKCGGCHKNSFTNFRHGHIPFAANYPFYLPNTVRYNHVDHANKSDDPRLASKFKDRPVSRCTTCHQLTTVGREVRPSDYQKSCAACHDSNIPDRELILFSKNEPGGLTPLLLETVKVARKPGSVEQRLLQELARSGLTSDVIRKASAVMVSKKEEHVLPEGVRERGWSTDGDALHYRPSGHADPVLMAWFSLAYREYARTADVAAKQRASEALEVLLDVKAGPGACAKCHASGPSRPNANGGGSPISWTYQIKTVRLHTKFDHNPHMDRADPDQTCAGCHRVNEEADYDAYFKKAVAPSEYVSNFFPIGKNTCTACHTRGIVRDDCQTCHTYHFKASPDAGRADLSVIK